MINKKISGFLFIVLLFYICSASIGCDSKKKSKVNNSVSVDLITDSQFEHFIDSEEPVLVYFWAKWCKYCTAFAPVVDQVSIESEFPTGKLNIDSCPKTYQKYKEKYIPMIVVFKNSKVLTKIVGTTPKKVILQKLKDFVTSSE